MGDGRDKKKKLRPDNMSETSDKDDQVRQKRLMPPKRTGAEGKERRDRRFHGDRPAGSRRDGRPRPALRDKNNNDPPKVLTVENVIPTPPPANTLELFPSLVATPTIAITTSVPIQGRWADIASK